MNINEKVLERIKQLNMQYFTLKQLCAALGTSSSAERKTVACILDELTAEYKVIFDERNKRYRLAREGEFSTAVFEGNARGFGFLLVDDGDLFVPASKTHGAFHKDVVLYRRVEGTKDEAEVISVVKRGMTELVGAADKSHNVCFVVPDEQRFISDVFIPKDKTLNVKNGQKVVVRVTSFPSDNRNNPEGEIIQILGYPDEKDVDLVSVAYSYGLTSRFPDEVEKYAGKLPKSVEEKDLEGRRDLRGELIFTIDGEDAKDLDDAVSVCENGDGTYTLGVHIADVSHYVKPQSEIDKEAFKRGTSVYFPNTVFPMLPTSLSNGVCSLYQGVDRLTLSCLMTVNSQGKVTDCEIFPSVINSRHRLTYTAVQGIFDGDGKLAKQYADITDALASMKKLAEILQKKRSQRGNIDFESKEVYFVTDENGKTVDVVPYEHTFAHQLIEEFMILANECVAEYAQTCNLPFVYRIHEKPDREKLSVLFSLMNGVGINVKRSQEIHNSVLQDALEQAFQTPYFHLINDVMLRTMQKAKYSAVNSGHFGLASSCYCHFTSPIRRYPDLEVHRIIKTSLAGKMTEKALGYYEERAEEVSKQSSIREKTADEAERKADDVKKCSYAETVLGQVFDALVSGVTERGIYAELPNTVEGFISADKLGGYFKFNKERFCLYNDAVNYSLGDKIRITVESVNKQTAKIDFSLAQKGID